MPPVRDSQGRSGKAFIRTPPVADEPLFRLTEALAELEEHVAGLPAHSAAGLLVRLRVLWGALEDTRRLTDRQ